MKDTDESCDETLFILYCKEHNCSQITDITDLDIFFGPDPSEPILQQETEKVNMVERQETPVPSTITTISITSNLTEDKPTYGVKQETKKLRKQEIQVPSTISIISITSDLTEDKCFSTNELFSSQQVTGGKTESGIRAVWVWNSGTSDEINEDLTEELGLVARIPSSSSSRSKNRRKSGRSKRVDSGNMQGKKRDEHESNSHSRKEKRLSGAHKDIKSEIKRRSSKKHLATKSRRNSELVREQVAGVGKDPSGNMFVFKKPAAITNKKKPSQGDDSLQKSYLPRKISQVQKPKTDRMILGKQIVSATAA